MKKIIILCLFLIGCGNSYDCDWCEKPMKEGDRNWLTNDGNSVVGEGASFAHYCTNDCRKEGLLRDFRNNE